MNEFGTNEATLIAALTERVEYLESMMSGTYLKYNNLYDGNMFIDLHEGDRKCGIVGDVEVDIYTVKSLRPLEPDPVLGAIIAAKRNSPTDPGSEWWDHIISIYITTRIANKRGRYTELKIIPSSAGKPDTLGRQWELLIGSEKVRVLNKRQTNKLVLAIIKNAIERNALIVEIRAVVND